MVEMQESEGVGTEGVEVEGGSVQFKHASEIVACCCKCGSPAASCSCAVDEIAREVDRRLPPYRAILLGHTSGGVPVFGQSGALGTLDGPAFAHELDTLRAEHARTLRTLNLQCEAALNAVHRLLQMRDRVAGDAMGIIFDELELIDVSISDAVILTGRAAREVEASRVRRVTR